MTSCLNFSAASAHSCTIHSCSYKPADTRESFRSSRSSHGGDANCGLRRIFQWTFLVGNVSTPIIGADFLYNFRLVPDISKQALLDSETNIKCHCILGNSRIHSIKTVSGDSVYHELLRKFPDITKPPRPDQEIKHSVVHYIETNSRPVTAKARRLAPDRLRIAKAEFENMITLGHMRPSKSNYASPLHMVPKKTAQSGDQSAITVHSMLKLLKIIIAFPIF
ncbi:transposon Ty3-I Gag-Pol polyprotein [Trichonephila clavipes]|nr:transposon Ty3-I Gag-Pol polyprotein [Trichonephila clavipes]